MPDNLDGLELAAARDAVRELWRSEAEEIARLAREGREKIARRRELEASAEGLSGALEDVGAALDSLPALLNTAMLKGDEGAITRLREQFRLLTGERERLQAELDATAAELAPLVGRPPSRLLGDALLLAHERVEGPARRELEGLHKLLDDIFEERITRPFEEPGRVFGGMHDNERAARWAS